MAAGSMLRLTQSFYILNIHAGPWNIAQRGISNKTLLEKLGLPERPKKPMTPFFMFKETIKNDLVKENPGISAVEMSRLASKLWKEVGKREKEEFKEKFQKEHEKYKLELLKYRKSLTTEQKSEIKDAEAEIKALKEEKIMKQMKRSREVELKKPKGPSAVFVKFIMTEDRGDASVRDHIKKMGEKWKKMSDHTKQKYLEEYKKESEQYKMALDLWEEEMIKQGNLDVVRAKTLKQKMKKNS